MQLASFLTNFVVLRRTPMSFDSMDLTMEQQFELRRIQDSIKDADHEQVVELLLSVSQLLMRKDNVIKDLIKQVGV